MIHLQVLNLLTYELIQIKKYILTSVFVLSQNKVTQEKYIKHFLIKTIQNKYYCI